MRKIAAVFFLLFTIAATWALNTKFGEVPPLGKFFNPFSGFWQNAESAEVKSFEIELSDEQLKDEVRIYFDDNLVPHIFAKNDHDLYFAQGFVTAKLRLWQMDFQTLFAAGRLCEVIGEKALPLDRFQRKIGMKWGAERNLEFYSEDERTMLMLDAYAAGANSYISSLSSKDYPFEYKLLDYKPEAWSPLKSCLLLNYMVWDLSGYNTDLRLTNVLRKYGMDVIEDLYLRTDTFMDPIIPPGTEYDFDTIYPTDLPENAYALPETFAGEGGESLIEETDPDKGSNNWVIGGAKSKTNYPILANDPHLTLTLPSIWMQTHLNAPGVNVYGACLQGAPGVIIGFNEKMAWGFTNVDSDIMDFYAIQFRDDKQEEYLFDGEWKKTEKRTEIIKIRGAEDHIEEVVHTHHGPVIYHPDEEPIRKDYPAGAAMRWMAHYSNDAINAFYKLNRATNYDDYVGALVHFHAPAQNFIFADQNKDIAIWPNGKFPLKWKGQGQFILDGTNPANEWASFIPQEQNPHSKNPERNYLSSANQDVTDSIYPYYLNWEFTTFERGARINDLLEVLENASADDLRNIQNDNFNLQAKHAVPVFLDLLNGVKSLNEIEKSALEALVAWDFNNNADAIGASIYTSMWDNFKLELFRDDFPISENLLLPDNTKALEILIDTTQSPWIDNRSTDKKESKADLVENAFRKTVIKLNEDHGDISEWQWWKVKKTEIRHMARLDGFSSGILETGGGHNIVNATKQYKGPSWRMVVELGEWPNAYGIYPGGQSGNPGSPFYDNMVEDWSKGNLRPLNFVKNSEDLENVIGTIVFTK